MSFHSKCFKQSNSNSNVNLNHMHNTWLCTVCAAETMPFLYPTDQQFTDLFSNPSTPLPTADNLNQLLSGIPDQFNSDDDAAFSSCLDSYYSVEEAKILLNNSNIECSFSTICVNVRSLMNPHRHNSSKFESLISGLDFQPHIIAVNETWEKPYLTGQFKNLQGYVYVPNPRVISRGGGVGMYIKRISYSHLVLNHQ